MSWAISGERLRETPALIAFRHPEPSYRFHVLIVPKRAIARLADLTPADADFTLDLFRTMAAKNTSWKHPATA